MFNSLSEISSAVTALGRLLWQLIPSRKTFFAAVATLLLAGALEASSVALLVPLLSSLTGKGFGSELLQRLLPDLAMGPSVALLAGLTLLLIALKNAIFFASVVLSTRLRRDGTIELRNRLMRRTLHAPGATLERRTSGDLMNVFLTEATRTSLAFDFTIQLTQRAVLALSYLLAILVISWQLTLLTALLGACIGVVGLSLSRRLLKKSKVVSDTNASLARRLSEIVVGLRLIRTTHSQAREQQDFDVANREQAGAEVAMTRAGALLTTSVETIAVATAMVVTAVAYQWLLVPGRLSVPAFLAFGFGLLRLLPALNQVYNLQVVVLGLSTALGPTREWLTLPEHPARPFGAARLAGVKQGIRFEDLSFRYDDGTQALSGVSLTLAAGSFLAIVGMSGAGKTTLASLLLRLHAPSSGKILIDGRDHWEFEPASYARAIAYVEQDPILFNASVLDNVRYGAPEVSVEQVKEALDAARLSDVVERLPRGVDTVLAERGSSLSGGERQRLAIARALVRSPSVIVMDEPTSALDSETEREVVAAIERARAGRTLIVIAHRESTIQRADTLLRLKDGRVQGIEVRAAQ